jgi:hypothetical protein
MHDTTLCLQTKAESNKTWSSCAGLLVWPLLPAHYKCCCLLFPFLTLSDIHIHTHSVILLWTRDRPDTETSTCRTHNTHKRQTSVTRAGFEPTNPRKRAAVDLRLRSHGHWDLDSFVLIKFKCGVKMGWTYSRSGTEDACLCSWLYCGRQ